VLQCSPSLLGKQQSRSTIPKDRQHTHGRHMSHHHRCTHYGHTAAHDFPSWLELIQLHTTCTNMNHDMMGVYTIQSARHAGEEALKSAGVAGSFRPSVVSHLGLTFAAFPTPKCRRLRCHTARLHVQKWLRAAATRKLPSTAYLSAGESPVPLLPRLSTSITPASRVSTRPWPRKVKFGWMW
jgi:hypothetical protein